MIAVQQRRDRMALRRMRLSDLDAVLAIELRSFPQPWSREFFRKELAASQATCTVATASVAANAPVVGYSVCWRVLDELHLLNVAVSTAHRGGGVGRRLVEATLEAGRASGGAVVYLEVRAGNVAARRLYRRLGFRDLGVRRGYYGPGEDAIVMECRLERPA